MERVGVRVDRMLVTSATAGLLSTASALRVYACMPRGLAACVGGGRGIVHAQGVCSSSSDDAGATMSSGAQEAVPSTTSGDVALSSWGPLRGGAPRDGREDGEEGRIGGWMVRLPCMWVG